MLKIKITKKLLFGLIVVAMVVTVITVANTTDITAEPPYEKDPDDPGDSPGPGNDPNLGSIIIDIPFEFSEDLTHNLG